MVDCVSDFAKEYRDKCKVFDMFADIYDRVELTEDMVSLHGRKIPKGHRSIRIKSPGEIKNLILEGYDINKKNENGNTVLHQNVKDNLCPIVRRLCEAGADVNIKDDEGVSPLETAMNIPGKYGCESAKILKEYGA